MMLRLALFTLVSLAGSLVAAQPPPPANPQDVAPNRIPANNLPIDPQKLATAINASFYHPDKLNGITCAVRGDWSTMYKSLNIAPPEPRMLAIKGLKMRYTAVRKKLPELTFDWTSGPPDLKDEFETGVKQMIGGFYQSYWTVMATPPMNSGSEIGRIEPQTDGTTKLYQSDKDNKVSITIDKNDAPTHYEFDTPAAKGEFDLQYVASPNPVPGDLRRISNLHINSKIGESSFNVAVSMTYQALDEFFVPRRVRYEMIGAYSIALEFSGCSVLKPDSAASQIPPPQ
jgi:hypothetical protein